MNVSIAPALVTISRVCSIIGQPLPGSLNQATDNDLSLRRGVADNAISVRATMSEIASPPRFAQ
jgi:hypothetical protein